jgi:hypothetical protein
MMHDPDFVAGRVDIGWWDRKGKALMGAAAPDRMIEEAAVAAALLEEERRGHRPGGRPAAAAPAAPARSYASAWLDVARREGLR